MKKFTQIYLFVFGLLTAVGGYIGYSKAGSVISLIAGGLCGVVLIVAALQVSSKPRFSSWMTLVISTVLIGRFLPILIVKGKVMPAIPILLLSLIAIGLAVQTLRQNRIQ